MAELKDFLKSFKKILEKGDGEKNLIINVFKKVLNVEIKKEDFRIKNNVLYLKSNPYIKSEVSMNKNRLLKEIKKEGLEVEVKDIK